MEADRKYFDQVGGFSDGYEIRVQLPLFVQAWAVDEIFNRIEGLAEQYPAYEMGVTLWSFGPRERKELDRDA